jgi:HSP20 family molecular chaperone IbpA
LFDEGDHFLITVEMPGVSIDDIELDLQGKQLTLQATSQPVL